MKGSGGAHLQGCHVTKRTSHQGKISEEPENRNGADVNSWKLSRNVQTGPLLNQAKAMKWEKKEMGRSGE